MNNVFKAKTQGKYALVIEVFTLISTAQRIGWSRARKGRTQTRIFHTYLSKKLALGKRNFQRYFNEYITCAGIFFKNIAYSEDVEYKKNSAFFRSTVAKALLFLIFCFDHKCVTGRTC